MERIYKRCEGDVRVWGVDVWESNELVDEQSAELLNSYLWYCILYHGLMYVLLDDFCVFLNVILLCVFDLPKFCCPPK